MAYIQGAHHWYGATLAAEEINAAGGIEVDGTKYTIELVRIDSNEMQPGPEAVGAVERAITALKVDFLIGGFRTEAMLAMTEVAADYKKIFLIAGAADDALLKGRVDKNYDRYKYLFRVTPVRSTSLARVSFILLGEVMDAFRRELGIAEPRVAIIAEQAAWANQVVTLVELMANAPLPFGLGGKHVGTWRPSALATSVAAELSAVERAGAHIVFTVFSGPVGVVFGRDWGRLQIPVATVGINVEAQAQGWLTATGGFGAYMATVGIYAEGVAVTEKTLPFVDSFRTKFGEIPLYTAGTYDAIYILADAIRRAGSLQTDAVIQALEVTDYVATLGRVVFDELHDPIWGPEHLTGLGVQWQEGAPRAFWPREWQPDPAAHPGLVVGYPGTVPYQIPPWVVDHWRGADK
ncbi:ABC transporter substrate-binding protein [Candidatus Bipolaricaulota bacterium]|nr:ABC transporter substrate-binding protein [Candidatus Bipolaricaulota bacterium]